MGEDIDALMARLGYYPLDPAWHPPARSELDRLQQAAGCSLPPDYISFLEQYGPGGLGDSHYAALPAGCPIGARFNLDLMYGVGSRDSWNPFKLLATTYEGQLAKGYFPVATDPGGNLLVLSCSSNEIWAWDHEHRELGPQGVEQVVASLKSAGIDTAHYDMGQLILLWEESHAGDTGNRSGHGNLYRIANSWTALLTELQP